MKKTEFLGRIGELVGADPQSIAGGDTLMSLSGWDSVAVVGFLALCDEDFGVQVKPDDIAECRTVDDLCSLVPGKLTD
ncbi:MAG TPA: acyl carrier protein [Tepidisphaeraceae bacterium]|jgi:acyl carrier protein